MPDKLPIVLLVEDSDIFRSMLRVYLAELPLEVLEANDGDTALTLLDTTDVALIVADLNMERVGGLALLAAVRAHVRPGVRSAKFALMTAEEPTSARFIEAQAARADAMFLKPVKPKSFRETVTQLLSR